VAYLEALRRALPRLGEGGALASVLEHCMYCGMSLGRVGLDLRGLLPPLFEAAALGLFRSAVQARRPARPGALTWSPAPSRPGTRLVCVSCRGCKCARPALAPQWNARAEGCGDCAPAEGRRARQGAVDAFVTVLDAHKWVALAPAARSRRAPPPAASPAAAPAAAEAARADTAPPYALMDHAPLATLANGLLGALNELRHCAPLALAAPCAHTLQASGRRPAPACARSPWALRGGRSCERDTRHCIT